MKLRTLLLPATLVLTLVVASWVARGGESFGATPAASPVVSCAVSGTPQSGVAVVPDDLGCQPAVIGTPVAFAGLTVTLTLSSNKAAPQNIVVTVLDERGISVDDATVTLVNRHLEMDHGDFVRLLIHDRDGRYLGDKVGMGMGGRWQTEIQIARPGHETVTFIFEETLEGLK